MQDIENIIQSVTKRIVHDSPSQKTYALIAGLQGSLETHIKKEELELSEAKHGFAEIKDHLKRQDEAFNQFRQETREHMARVEPVIQRFEEEKAFNSGVKQLGKRAIFWSRVIGAVGVLVWLVKYVILHLISK